MRYEIMRNGIRVDETLEKAIGHKVDKVAERLKRYHPEASHLEIRLEHVEKAKEFGCSIQLKAFREAMHAAKSSPELRVAVDKSFEALLREIDHYRAKINKSIANG